jgi:hypothetical protein
MPQEQTAAPPSSATIFSAPVAGNGRPERRPALNRSWTETARIATGQNLP